MQTVFHISTHQTLKVMKIKVKISEMRDIQLIKVCHTQGDDEKTHLVYCVILLTLSFHIIHNELFESLLCV